MDINRILVAIVGCTVLSPLALHAAPIGKPLPDGVLMDTDGKKRSLAELRGDAQAFVLVFSSKECPFNVKRWDRIGALAKELQSKGVRFMGVNCNPKEPLADVISFARKKGAEFPILRDEGKVVVQALEAKATPHMFVFDQKGVLRYAGAFDDSADADKVKEQFCKDAILAVLAGKEIATPEPKAFIGCSIKD